MLTATWLYLIEGIPDKNIYAIDNSLRLLAYALQLVAVLIFYLSLQPINVKVFLGIKAFPEDTEPFVIKGIYGYIRHPMYSSTLLFLLARPTQSVNSLTLIVVIALYFIIGSRLEEQRLLSDHPEYDTYRQHVPAFIPSVRKKND